MDGMYRMTTPKDRHTLVRGVLDGLTAGQYAIEPASRAPCAQEANGRRADVRAMERVQRSMRHALKGLVTSG